ncbi:MAG: decarboxylating NADP(+)-dependent phosphogluconate dehydrogenase [Thermoanaerobaculia bacterium]
MAARLGIIGLGVMGENLALNAATHGISVAVWNLETEWTETFLRGPAAGREITGARTFEELAAALEPPRRILMMIRAGDPVDQTVRALAPLLEAGDVLVDGGNSHFADTERRQRDLESTGVRFIGCGVSGGEEGARSGAALMPGGDRDAWPLLEPILTKIAAKSEHGPCVGWIGTGGAGHFVKMVHNGIEYGDMQGIAEAYDLLRRLGGMKASELAEVFSAWNEGPLESFLLRITARIFRVIDEETGRPLVDLVLDAAGQKGTGRWAAEVALEIGLAVPTLSAAVYARVLSSMKEERRAAAAVLSGPGAQPEVDREKLIRDAHDALLATRICAFAQGFALIETMSARSGWGIDRREVARVWTAGCIIRAELLEPIMAAFARKPDLANLVLDPAFAETLGGLQEGWRRTVALGQTAGVPLPAMSASLAWYDACRTESLPQNLTQAQRDYFGAHGFQRIDRPELGKLHAEWSPEE